MTNNPNVTNEDVSLPDDIPTLEAQIAGLEATVTDLEQRIITMRNSEDVAKGIIFAQEIFTAQQDKLRLGVEIEFRRKKINRIMLSTGERDLF